MKADPARPALGRLRKAIAANPLRAAELAAAAWASGTVLLTSLSLVVQAQELGWQGIVAPLSLLPALVFATTSYLLRFLRWHFLARRVAPALGFRASAVLWAIGFALIMTPGRAGEFVKLLLLRQRTAVPVATSTSVLVVERGSEAAALGLLAVAASLFLPWAEPVLAGRRLILFGALLVGLALAITFWRRVADVVPRLPLAGRLLARPGPARLWSNLIRGGDRELNWPVLLTAVGITLVARLCDGLAIYWAAGLYGVQLSLAASWFLIGSSGFLGGVSMLPGGAGVAEATLIGLLLAFGADLPAATATALTSRVLSLWLWVTIGLGLALRYAAQPWPDAAETEAA